METLLIVFIVVTLLALLVQVALLTSMYFGIRQTTAKLERTTTELHQRLDPILVSVDILLRDSRDKLTNIVTDAAEITRLARQQMGRMDDLVTDATDRARLQVIRVDQLISQALERVEDAGTELQKNILGPIREASAVIRGVKTGLDYLLSRRRVRSGERAQQDEELFI